MALYACYMPFVENGGLFVPSEQDPGLGELALGEKVGISLDLMHEPETFRAEGRVVWITPQGAEGNRVAGTGVALDTGSESIRRKIEKRLAGAVASQHQTHTL